MGRSVWVAAVSFLLILGLYFVCDGAGRRASRDLLQACDEIESLRFRDSEGAMNALLSLEERWQRRAEIFSGFMHHQRLEDITRALTHARIALGQEDDLQWQLSLAELRQGAKSLYEAEAFLLKNVW